MKLLVYIIVVTLLGATLFEVNKALGSEWPHVMQVNTVVCDEQKQAEHILATARDKGFDEAKEVYLAYFSQKNDQAEPVCGVVHMMVMIEQEVAVYRNLKIGTVNVNAHILSVRTPHSPNSLYMIFLRAAAENGV